MNKKLNSKNGFTLIELMVVVAIVVIVFTMVYSIWKATVDSHALVDAKVKMRDESRIALEHMTGNLQMAAFNNQNVIDDADLSIIQYNDGAGDVDWPPPVDALNTDWSIPTNNISFIRPQAGLGGLPFEDDSATVIWSEVVRFQLDTDNLINDNIVNQLIQVWDDDDDPATDLAVRLLVDNISAVVDDASTLPYKTGVSGGLAFRASTNDTSLIWISLIVRRSLGPGEPTIVIRYDDFVDVRN